MSDNKNPDHNSGLNTGNRNGVEHNFGHNQNYNYAKVRKLKGNTSLIRWTFPMNTSNAAYSSKYDPLSSYNWSIIFTWPLFCLFFCECNIKVLLRGLYNSDCPLNKLKMDKNGNLRNFSPILENIWEYVTNRNRDWQVLQNKAKNWS